MRRRAITVFALVLALTTFLGLGSLVLYFAAVAAVSVLGGVIIGQSSAVQVAFATTVTVQFLVWALLLLLFVGVPHAHAQHLEVAAILLGPIVIGTASAALGVWLRRRLPASPAVSS